MLYYPAVSNVHHHIVSATSISTATTLVITPNPSPAGRPVLLTATVSPNPGGGTIRFSAGADLLATRPLENGQATLLVQWPYYAHFVTATSSGSGAFSSSFSPFVASVATGIDEVPALDARGAALLAAMLAIVAGIALRR